MDLEVRKYHFIQELLKVEEEQVLLALEQVLKDKKNTDFVISENHKGVLNQRLMSYKENPNDVLNWEDVKKDW